MNKDTNISYYKYLKYRNKYIKLKEKIINKNIWVMDNFFENQKFDTILNYSKNLLSELKSDNRVNSRQTLCLHPEKHKIIYDLIYDDIKFKNYIGMISNEKFKNRPSFPIELRLYPTGSHGMAWHKDLSLFEPDCYEVVLTLENTSDSKFLYSDKKIHTNKNMLTIVKPNTIMHKVTPVNNGERLILKFVVEFLDKDNNNLKKLSFYNEFKKCPF